MPANQRYSNETKGQFSKRKALKGAPRRKANEEAKEGEGKSPFSRAEERAEGEKKGK